jgi:hypothetical protein
MGYRFYTSREYAKLNAVDARRRAMAMGGPEIKRRYAYPVQAVLAEVINQIPADRQDLARMFMRMGKLSPKQIAACQRWIDRAKGIAA